MNHAPFSIRRALVVAPHPDDEIIGAAMLILQLVQNGTRVAVVVVTDGAASHTGSVQWPRARLVAERQRESRRALRRLGVPGGHVEFLGLPDGRLCEQPVACRRVLRRAIVRCRGIDLLIGPAADDAHPDHRAVADAVGACPSSARRLAYQVWPHDSKRLQRSVVVATAPRSMKRSLIRLHRTQLGAIRDDPQGFAIAPHELAAFAHPVERFSVERR